MRHTVRSRRVPTAALIAGLAAAMGAGLGACTPTVKVEAPDKPIEINLNIRIEQEVRVKVERDLEKAIADDPALFGLPPAQDGSGGMKGGKKP
ncbi:hypothetical protein FHW79_001889 [Azospirillum sp. OGB3]|uniref:YnbE family lipoprotein n=1 Tax=Azospirillum sp. OGB3 TaxID=2587012 RepID=UPI0016068A61|nr:YnbE family lipoprotein [Azospirillum sp. OGB3]MBB3264274.1 hypothetical protein [Azospirillum sp. OGB3]